MKAEDGTNNTVMDHVIHKVAFVMNNGKSVIFLAKRRMDSVHDQFKCHGFETSSSNTAKQLASDSSMTHPLRWVYFFINSRSHTDGGTAESKVPPHQCSSRGGR